MAVGMVRLSQAEQAFVEVQRIGHLATVSRAGEPTVVPVCYAYDAASGRFYTPIDEKPKGSWEQLARVRNIRHTGQAALVIDRYDEDWSRLAWVLVRGPAELVMPGSASHQQAITLLRARYPQYATMQLEALPVIALTPRHVRSWGQLTPPSEEHGRVYIRP